jgi:hypothetical protein
MKWMALILGVTGLSSAWCAQVTDDFNREDTFLDETGESLGTKWHSSRASAGWGIENGQVSVKSSEPNSVLYNSSQKTMSGSGSSFTVSLDVTARTSPVWAGIVLHYQDADNYYCFRYKAEANNYALARMVDGDLVNLVNLTLETGAFAVGKSYTLTVKSSDPYQFEYEIRETGESILATGVATDGNSSFTGGYAGILETTIGPNRNTFDNFSLEVVP